MTENDILIVGTMAWILAFASLIFGLFGSMLSVWLNVNMIKNAQVGKRRYGTWSIIGAISLMMVCSFLFCRGGDFILSTTFGVLFYETHTFSLLFTVLEVLICGTLGIWVAKIHVTYNARGGWILLLFCVYFTLIAGLEGRSGTKEMFTQGLMSFVAFCAAMNTRKEAWWKYYNMWEKGIPLSDENNPIFISYPKKKVDNPTPVMEKALPTKNQGMKAHARTLKPWILIAIMSVGIIACVITGITSYNTGLNSGYSQGKTVGYNAGKEEVSAERYQSGYDEGHYVGQAEGYSEGFTEGNQNAYNLKAEGFSSGYDSGYKDAFIKGFRVGASEMIKEFKGKNREITVEAKYTDAQGNIEWSYSYK